MLRKYPNEIIQTLNQVLTENFSIAEQDKNNFLSVLSQISTQYSEDYEVELEMKLEDVFEEFVTVLKHQN